MPSLKDLRNRINSVKSTRKITSAMKMVSAAKFSRAEKALQETRPVGAASLGQSGPVTSRLTGLLLTFPRFW